MPHFPDWLDATEAKIINTLIAAVIRRGYYIRVHDGERYAFPTPTRDRKLIQRSTAIRDVTVYMIYKQAKPDEYVFGAIGEITLCHGKGEDVVSNTSWAHGDTFAKMVLWQLAKEAAS